MPRLLPLAHGELSAADAAELQALKGLIEAAVGFHCQCYKEKCLRRRIAVRMRARGVASYGAYAELLRSDAAEYDALIDTITINVSKFFRNAETWRALREHVVPALFALPDPRIRIWSAGTASGEEAYTLAIVLKSFAEEHGLNAHRFSILATDIDRAILDVARRAEYGAFSFTETPPAELERWFTGGTVRRVREDVRRMVQFAPLDLLHDAFPTGLHLILCRNVVIYFERAAQERLFERLSGALVPGGFLVLGKVEALSGPATAAVDAVVVRERVYRRR